MKEISAAESHQTQAAVLKALLASPDSGVSSIELERITELDKKTVRFAIAGLRESGIGIPAGQRYTVVGMPDVIVPAVLLCGLRSRIIGRIIHSYKSIGSTNETARRLADSGAPEGTIVIAEGQNKGRGRLGRSWYSPVRAGLYFSIVLRPRIPVLRMPALSLVAALSVSRVLENFAGVNAGIKWPNDCLIGRKKVAGILVEVSAELDRMSYAILGIGINVNTGKKDFPSKLRSKATSIAVEVGSNINRTGLLRSLLYEFEKLYRNFCRYGLEFMAPELVKRSSVIGQNISIRVGKNRVSGRALGFDDNGALRVRTKNGVRSFTAGEVSLRG